MKDTEAIEQIRAILANFDAHKQHEILGFIAGEVQRKMHDDILQHQLAMLPDPQLKSQIQ